MSYDEEVYEKLIKNFNLLCNILRANSLENDYKVDLSTIEDIINNKIPDTLKNYAPEDFYDLYVDFKSEYERFKDFILYDKLIGKNVVSLGGGFSSGKSSFLNALMGKLVLPSDIDPSTSVPTYIVRGEQHEVLGNNVFDTKVSMKPKDIKKIAHGFGEVEDEDDESVTEAVTLGHVLENIFFSTPLHQYDNIAFLDTPGYSKPDSEKYSAKTDEKIARGQLNSSNYILWFVQADAGTITEEDIKFIKTLREDIPKLIIVNKADKKNLVDLKEIIKKIKSTLKLKNIQYVDVCAFSSKTDQIGEKGLRQFIEKEKEKIKHQMEEWNQQIYESNFARNFKIIFVRCKKFYEDEIEIESRKLTRLNTSITKLTAEDIDDEILQPLQLMVREAQLNVNKLKEVNKKLKELQNEFFTEIKAISDIVGIAMPEPSEIDLLQDKIQNPLELVLQYKEKKGIKRDVKLANSLQKQLGEVNRKNSEENIYRMMKDGNSNKKKEASLDNEYLNLMKEKLNRKQESDVKNSKSKEQYFDFMKDLLNKGK